MERKNTLSADFDPLKFKVIGRLKKGLANRIKGEKRRETSSKTPFHDFA